MKFVFTPISVIAGLLAGMLGKKIFERLWGLVDDEEPPRPEHREFSWPKLIAALVFDFDGLILDTEWSEFVTVQAEFHAYGGQDEHEHDQRGGLDQNRSAHSHSRRSEGRCGFFGASIVGALSLSGLRHYTFLSLHLGERGPDQFTVTHLSLPPMN